MGVLVSSHLGFGRELVAGILDYMRAERAWELSWRGDSREGLESLLREELDGLIGALQARWVRPLLAAKPRLATVNIYGGRPRRGLPQVGVDDVAIGRMAGEHLADRGYPRLGFVGLQDGGVSASRWFGLRSVARLRDRPADRLLWHHPYPPVKLPPGAAQRAEGRVSRWLAQATLPMGVLAVDDLRAWWVLEACRELGLRVPEDVGVVGVGNDAMLCQSPWPPLSSVRVPLRRCGEIAAEMLDGTIAHGRRKTRPVLLEPEGIEVRASTNAVAQQDPDVAAALAFIRGRPDGGGAVEEIVRQTRVCRRVLENKFRRQLGRTPFREMLEWRLEEAKRLLRETDWTLERIADATGFGAGVRLSAEFHRRTGRTPGAYRRLCWREAWNRQAGGG